MAFTDELQSAAQATFDATFEVSKGYAAPGVADIPLADNKGREVELAMLFIDIRSSTQIVDGFRRTTAAKMYKAFLEGVVRIAKNYQGDVRSFNGDGILVVFDGSTKATRALRTALALSWFGLEVLRPKVHSYFSKNSQLDNMEFRFAIGVDMGPVLVIRGGIKGESNNDLVWVGSAMNWAAKLSTIPDDGFFCFVSKSVYDAAEDSVRTSMTHLPMWERRSWRNETVYRSGWWWKPSSESPSLFALAGLGAATVDYSSIFHSLGSLGAPPPPAPTPAMTLAQLLATYGKK